MDRITFILWSRQGAEPFRQAKMLFVLRTTSMRRNSTRPSFHGKRAILAASSPSSRATGSERAAQIFESCCVYGWWSESSFHDRPEPGSSSVARKSRAADAAEAARRSFEEGRVHALGPKGEEAAG